MPEGSFSAIVPGMEIRVMTSPPEVGPTLAAACAAVALEVAAGPSVLDGFMPLAPDFHAATSILLAVPVAARVVAPRASSSGCRAASPRLYVSGADPVLVS